MRIHRPSLGLILKMLLFPRVLDLAEDRQFERLDLPVDFLGGAEFAVHGEQVFFHPNAKEAFVFFQIRLDELPVGLGEWSQIRRR